MTAPAATPTAASFFGWLDYDEREAQRMREVFAAFDDKDTVDSLGLGVIRDSLSDQLFPGTSTIQTRARYFLFVPWIHQILEAEQVPAQRFVTRLRELEVALIESLRQMAGPNQGVIGYRARSRVIRLPSAVYWNGLRAFGIRRLDLSSDEYRAYVAWPAAHGRRVTVDDDGETVTGQALMWDPNLPAAPDGFPHHPISLRLTPDEADYLVNRIARSHPDSLVGGLARDLTIDRSPETPWNLSPRAATPRVAEVLRHARNFSELMGGAQALYNLLLARRAEALLDQDHGALVDRITDELDEWRQLVAAGHDELSAWSTDEFWVVVERQGRVPAPTRRFVRDWTDLALRGYDRITEDPQAEALVTERERRLKGKLARLSEQRALENWAGDPFSPGLMTFRWRNARRLLDDLADPEER